MEDNNYGRDAGIDQLLLDTENMLANARAYLQQLAMSEKSLRVYLQEMEQMLEREIERLYRRKNGSEVTLD